MPKRKGASRASSTEAKRSKQESTAVRTLRSNAEADDLQLWGPYLSDRQWGTVREDLSKDGNCWEYFSHDAAVWRAYTSGEDGLLGFCDKKARMCVALALWNGKDAILKERLFGLTGPQGNHGEDVKECYYHLDNCPNHEYVRSLYKYPQQEFPYAELQRENQKRGLDEPEYELIDTGVFDDGDYWDVEVEYYKKSAAEIVCEYTVYNRGTQTSTIHIIPQVRYRSTWDNENSPTSKPKIKRTGISSVLCQHDILGSYDFVVLEPDQRPTSMFTENETNPSRLKESDLDIYNVSGSSKSSTGLYKDGFHHYVMHGNQDCINRDYVGTKFGAHYQLTVEPGESAKVIASLFQRAKESSSISVPSKNSLNQIKNRCIQTANDFYKQVMPDNLSEDEELVYKQAYAGLLSTKQYYQYDLDKYIKHKAKFDCKINQDWGHMKNHDIIAVPDKWEFPWYATWDLAFHMIPFAKADVEFAKSQLSLFLSKRYMHPNGQLPAYEFDFSDVNPPVHAWACLHIYRSQSEGSRDIEFLRNCFDRLLLNYGWWAENKQVNGSNLYGGGFLGMDNISVLNRSILPVELGQATLAQADGTGWMAFFAACMIEMALELATTGSHSNKYIDQARDIMQNFIAIATAINKELWDEDTGMYCDKITTERGTSHFIQARSMVGLVPLFGSLYIRPETLNKLPSFWKLLLETNKKHPQFVLIDKKTKSCLLTVVTRDRAQSLFGYMLDEQQLLSQYGVRSVSKAHLENPVDLEIGEMTFSMKYAPGESNSDMFGGNSNWRGPIWICMNYLLLHSMDQLDGFYGNTLKIKFPTRSQNEQTLTNISKDIARRIISIFLMDKNGHRPVHGGCKLYENNTTWKDLVLFYEYFNGNNGRGCGASHQTGWTALVTCLMDRIYEAEDK